MTPQQARWELLARLWKCREELAIAGTMTKEDQEAVINVAEHFLVGKVA